MKDFTNLVRGFLMGAADVVPGVSGGTVALVLGIYERLVSNIRRGASALGALVRGKGAAAIAHTRQVEWRFLLVLLGGIVLAVVTLARLIEHLLEDEPQATAAAFFGLVAGSIFIAWGLVGRWTSARIGAAAATAVAIWARTRRRWEGRSASTAARTR